MGKATKWLRGLFGIKKDKETTTMEIPPSISSSSSTTTTAATATTATHAKEKKRWSFSKQGRDSISMASPDATWLRSYHHLPQTEQQQNRHAIAVAAATAAAADAAVAAAHAAVAVVRLTNQGRGTVFSGGLENLAAVKIQNFFRGYLARKALRALKGLVKLQALVRGFLVRKQAAATFYSMQALIRAQVSVRCQRARRRISKEIRSQPRRSMERYEEARNEFHSKRLSVEHAHNVFDESPKIVEIDTFSKLRSRSRSGSRSRRIQTPISEFGFEDPYYYPTVSSPLPCRVHGRLSIPESRQLQDFEECRGAYTTQSTPRFTNSLRANAPPTPARSVCGDSFFRQDSNFPSYMANTQSFCAKLRSQSAPKQRPDEIINAAVATVAAAAAAASKKRMSLNEMMASRNSFSGIRMNRPSPAQFHEDMNS